MDMPKGKMIAMAAGIAGFVAILILLIVTLVMVNRTQSEVDTLTKQNKVGASQVRALHTAVAAAQRPMPVPVPVAARPAAVKPVRAAVMGSMPGGHAGAPYAYATASRTSGVPFPTAGAKAPAGKPAYKDSIWADPLPADSDASYKGARARQAAPGLGGGYAVTGTKELFNRTPDELDARDIDIKDAFPAPSDDAPKNGHEAIAAMYSHDAFRAAMDRNSFAGYLAPTYDRQGWSKLGTRDPCLWAEQMEALRDEFPKNMSLEELMDSQMVPVPDQFYDFFYNAAETRGVDGVQKDCDGMGGYASGRLYEALAAEAYEGKTPKRVGAGEAAQLIRDATQAIPRGNAPAALKAIEEIAAARVQADQDGLTLPELSHQQASALATWAASPTPVRAAAMQLARATHTSLPPAGY